MQAFTVLDGLVAPMDRANVDTDLIIPKGLAIPFPAPSGNDPCIGSKSAVESPTEALGSNPMEPGKTLASSVRISPNIFSVINTS